MKNKILCVDDEAEWRRMIGIFLKLDGFGIITAANASEAMLYAETEKPDAVVLDVNLAGENGAGLIGYLKTILPRTPIILYTGLTHDEDAIQRLLAKGAAKYLRKGNLRNLVKCVEDLLGARDPEIMDRHEALVPAGAWQVV
jgi:DNA-binding response OmpR family regulator